MRTSIYLPDDLAEDVKLYEVTMSAVAQDALRAAVAAKKALVEQEDDAEAVTPKGRTFVANFVGPDATSIEEKALAAAREVFGPDVNLTVVQDYTVTQNLLNHTDARYAAKVTVEVRSNLKELLTAPIPEGAKLIATVNQRFAADSVSEGIVQAEEEILRAFGPNVVVRSTLHGDTLIFNNAVLGSANVKVYLL
jgi:post-segregation antitoxin (ccd killing protein)